MSSRQLKMKLWGVRGSFPTPASRCLKYGGNTPCVELRLPGGDIVIFDAGSGIRMLGHELMREGLSGRSVHIFLTHFHWDHIHGLPFFAPLFGKDKLKFYTGGNSNSLQKNLHGLMTFPYFPVDFGLVSGHCEFHEIGTGPCVIDGVTIQAAPVNHPQGAFGYRVECEDKSIVYVPDREFGHPELDQKLREFANKANVLLLDAQYTSEEYPTRKGWGHSTWDDTVEVARDAKVDQLILFHHDPDHDDETLGRIESQAKQRFPNVQAGREGWTIEL